MKTTTPPVNEYVRSVAYEIMADQLESAGLRLEDNFRVIGGNMALSHAAAKAIAQTGFPLKLEGNDSLESTGITRTGGFWHPLGETISEEKSGVDGGAMNLWMAASLMINAAAGWLEEPSDNPAIPLSAITEAANCVAPTTSVPKLLRAARYDDAALLKLVGLVKDGLRQKIDRATAQ